MVDVEPDGSLELVASVHQQYVRSVLVSHLTYGRHTSGHTSVARSRCRVFADRGTGRDLVKPCVDVVGMEDGQREDFCPESRTVRWWWYSG